MQRIPVNSTNILSIGYDRESLLLEIEFQTKRVYRYSNVPPHVYAALIQAKSHGKYFQDHINGSYTHVEVG